MKNDSTHESAEMRTAQPEKDSTDEELSEDELSELDGGDGGSTTYPPYV